MSNEKMKNESAVNSATGHGVPRPLELTSGHREYESVTTIYYSAQTPTGQIELSISDHGLELTSLSPLRSRLELSRIEHVVRRLEDWLGVSLDLEPVTDVPESPLVMNVFVTGKVPRTIGVHMPCECWAMAGESGQSLDTSGLTVSWPDFYAKLLLASLNLSSEELAGIQNNATVLLPQSFEPPWNPKLFVPAINGCLEGHIAGSQLVWQTGKNFSPAIDSDIHRDVSAETGQEVTCFFSVSARMFFEISQADLGEFVTELLRQQGAILRCADGATATGTLIPIGQGIGFFINRVTGSAS